MKPIVSSMSLSRRVLLSTLAVLPTLIGPLLSQFRAGAAHRPIRCRPGTTARRKNPSPISSRASPRRAARLRAARSAHRHLRQRRHAVDRAADVCPARLRLDRVGVLAPQNPALRPCSRSRRCSIGDMKALAASGERGLVEIIAATHAGMTTDEFCQDRDRLARDRARSAVSSGPTPSWSTSRCWSCSLSARQRLQDLHRFRRRHRVHASLDRADLRNPARAGGRLLDQDPVRDARRAAQPVPPAGDQFHRRQGRQAGRHQRAHRPPPIAAFGNSDGDLEMLQWTTMSGSGARLG